MAAKTIKNPNKCKMEILQKARMQIGEASTLSSEWNNAIDHWELAQTDLISFILTFRFSIKDIKLIKMNMSKTVSKFCGW